MTVSCIAGLNQSLREAVLAAVDGEVREVIVVAGGDEARVWRLSYLPMKKSHCRMHR